MSEEEWREVPGYPDYEVSDQGRVRSWKGYHGRPKPYYLTPQAILDGRFQVKLGGKTRNVHTLVLNAFVGPAPEGMQCRHLDGDCTNNRLSNLAWGTAMDNYHDKHRHGTDTVGERHPLAKLTEAQVREIRARHVKGVGGNNLELRGNTLILAREFGVTAYTIRDIVSRKRWSHVE